MKTKFFCMLSLLAACCWTAHGAVIDLNGVDLTVTEPNADGYVNTSQTAATLTLDLAGPVAYAGTISGNLSLIKAGAGTLTLSNACPYTGTTHVNGGVLEAPTDAYFGFRRRRSRCHPFQRCPCSTDNNLHITQTAVRRGGRSHRSFGNACRCRGDNARLKPVL